MTAVGWPTLPCNVPDVLGQLCGRWAVLLAQGAVGSPAAAGPSVFQSCELPIISLPKYLTRLASSLPQGDEEAVCLVAVIYLHRLHTRGETVSAMTLHRLLAICVRLATHFCLEDGPAPLLDYARLAGLRWRELKLLEVRALLLLDWRLSVSSTEYVCYWKLLLQPATTSVATAEQISHCARWHDDTLAKTVSDIFAQRRDQGWHDDTLAKTASAKRRRQGCNCAALLACCIGLLTARHV